MVFFVKNASATHIYGGDLLYKHVSGDTYQITLTMYGDCSGSAYSRLFNASPKIEIFRGSVFWDSLRLVEDALQRKEVSPVCPEEAHNTSCRSDGDRSLPGVTVFVFTANVTLPPNANWRIFFNGIMGNTTSAGRSNSITNIVNGTGGQIMSLLATLNNLDGPNNSPVYTTIPTPFYCLNLQQQYNQGAADQDGDSLEFALVPAKINGTASVNYISPYSATQPLQTSAGNFTFDGNTGQMDFFPDAVQRSLVVNEVREYKDGKLVGSSMREMTFIILDNCNNNPPTGNLSKDNIHGGVVTDDNAVNACTNTPNLNFNIPVRDNENDSIYITLNNIPKGASASVIGNGTTEPKITVSWNLNDVVEGKYYIYATYKDDACPLAGTRTVVYIIRVYDSLEVTHEVIEPTNCKHKQYVEIRTKGGTAKKEIMVSNSQGELINTYIDSTGSIRDSFTVGTYYVHVSSESLPCTAYYSFTVDDYGTYPVPPIVDDINICIYDEPIPFAPKIVGNAILNWYTLDGKRMDDNPTYVTSEPRVFKWITSQTVGICESVKDTVTATVHDLPNIEILNTPERLCIGEGIFLYAKGGVRYTWQPDHRIEMVDSNVYTYITEPTTYIVKGYSEYNCLNTDTVTYDDIEMCCKFSYPNAFTPNRDGVNDGWKPVVYGHVQNYLLLVYNRWGEKIFETSHPKQYWDGTFAGKECQVGTYFYRLKSTCVTGQEEVSGGSFTLIR
ncbi:MAG: gliding motility-associated C-terminal domain-containing protein [Chitinophagales bacterium]|nr:gliding motility-associated C-terminal domain-containing protein [Chitinophagaceae bacterium]MCB9064838.1 gliding motility-associated C-terminal domain-containing protein [Chitinophagales bacterium]